MGMYGYVWLCMGMYGYVWVCMGMYGYVWVCMAIHRSSRSSRDIFTAQGSGINKGNLSLEDRIYPYNCV